VVEGHRPPHPRHARARQGRRVSLRIEKDKLIIERADESAVRSKRQAKLEKARARMNADIGGTLRKLAK
jgi:hypothetical protein